MSDAKTKSCNLTEAEIKTLISSHGMYASSDPDMRIERMNYLNKRLKTFNEPEAVKPVEIPKAPEPQAAHDAPKGWGQ